MIVVITPIEPCQLAARCILVCERRQLTVRRLIDELRCRDGTSAARTRDLVEGSTRIETEGFIC
jgi:hypothetical protein